MKSVKMMQIGFRAAIILAASLAVARAANFKVLMSDYAFSPSSLSIAIGDTVTWTNTSSSSIHPHTATSGNTTICSPNQFWNSGNLAPHATYTITFTNFAAATYTYLCSNHCSAPFNMKGTLIITNPPNAPPAISITNPPGGGKFPAPASFTLQASASGSVTNVQFFSGGNSIGNKSSTPYDLALSGVAAGNYAFTAQATDNQSTTATSAVVNVFVLTNAILKDPTQLSNGQFQVTVVGIAGQTYATEISTNLADWSAINTNVAPSNTFNILDSPVTNSGRRFYRARQDLN